MKDKQTVVELSETGAMSTKEKTLVLPGTKSQWAPYPVRKITLPGPFNDTCVLSHAGRDGR